MGVHLALLMLWGSLVVGVIYWKISNYLDAKASIILIQRAGYFQSVDDEHLLDQLRGSQVYAVPGLDVYGLFDSGGKHLAGNLLVLSAKLPIDGNVHFRPLNLDMQYGYNAIRGSYALGQRRSNGDVLILVRNGGAISVVSGIIGESFFLGLTIILIPGLIGWRLIRLRSLRRVEVLRFCTQRIVSGNMAERLPISKAHDELDMLSNAVNTMLEHIEMLMHEVKSVCDNIAHDLRTPLTRLQARLYQLNKVQLDSVSSLVLDEAMGESEALMIRFQGLLRISELEDARRRVGFVPVNPIVLLQQAHDFYEPMAQQKGQALMLDMQRPQPDFLGDLALMFEVLINLLDNAVKFTQQGGVLQIVSRTDHHGLHIEVIDSGPGIPTADRELVTRRLYRGDPGRTEPGHGLGLSLVAAIVRLHGFKLSILESDTRGARIIISCPPDRLIISQY